MSGTPEQIDDAVVEHVAQAISFNDNGNYTPNYKWSLVPEVLQDSYRRNARAAITAYLSATKDAQAERVRVLEGLVRSAFYEGFNSYRTPCVSFSDPDEEWEASEARAAIAKATGAPK